MDPVPDRTSTLSSRPEPAAAYFAVNEVEALPLLMVTVPRVLPQATSTVAAPPSALVQATVTDAGSVHALFEEASGTTMSAACAGLRLASAASTTVTCTVPGVRKLVEPACRLSAGW